MAVALVGMVRVRSFTIDDAYISYRYARNFARGWGLVYNFGERVEGYTNFLFTLLLAGVHRLGFDVDGGAKVLGGASALASLWLLERLAERVGPRSWVPCLATWALASSMIFSGYAVYGLETPLFVMLVLAGTVLFFEEEDRPWAERTGWARVPWSGAVFGLAGLTRPEAPLYLGVVMLFVGGRRLVAREDEREGKLDTTHARLALGLVGLAVAGVVALHLPRSGWGVKVGFGLVALGLAGLVIVHLPRRLFSRTNLARGGIFVAMVGGHILWRRSYYGKWLPNTLGAKTGNLDTQLATGKAYALAFVQHEGALLVLAAFGVVAALLYRHRELWVAITLTSLVGAYVVLVGGDWMPTFRFFAPVLPFVALLADAGVRAVLRRRDRVVHVGLACLLVFAAGERWWRGERDVSDILNHHQVQWSKTATPVAAWFAARLAAHGDAARGWIAMGDIGEIGYVSDLPVMDLLGLVDPVIAEQPGGYGQKEGKGLRDHFYERLPRYFLMISERGDCTRPHHHPFRVVYYDPRFRTAYRLVETVPIQGWAWCIFEHRAFPPLSP